MLEKIKISPLQLLILLLFFSTLILVFFLPHSKNNQKPIVNVSTIDTTLSINVQVYTQEDSDIKTILNHFEKKEITLDSLIRYLSKKGKAPLAAYFEEIKYLSSPSDTVWFYVGKNYYQSLGFISHSSEAEAIIASAARCFNRALSLNEKNINARIMLASCYVQTQNPMLGVQMLKEIEKTDSNNVLLQMQFAEFSIRSNQLDKAIQRYQKALQLDSNKTEIYAYLSEIYLQKKDTLQSIQFLRKFAAKISDTTLKNSINQYILSIQKNQNIH